MALTYQYWTDKLGQQFIKETDTVSGKKRIIPQVYDNKDYKKIVDESIPIDPE